VSWATGGAAGGAILSAATALAVVRFMRSRRSRLAVTERDGLAAGEHAPGWSLSDSAALVHTSPPALPLQLVVLADHSLRSFPSVADGLRDLAIDGTQTEVVLLLREPSPMAQTVLAEFGLYAIAVLQGSPELYAAYNVRTGPYLIFVDSAGVVRASGLVNHSWQVARLRKIAGRPVRATAPARPRDKLQG